MYSARLRTLERAYKNAEKNNKLYAATQEKQHLHTYQLQFISGLFENIKALDLAVTKHESEWRQAVLSMLETEIMNDLSFVYPSDGYQVSLSSKVSRGKIHINATVTSTFSNGFPGKIKGTQGRLFQQLVSFAALIGVMSLLGIKTVYIDEAFSGASKKNVQKLNKLLDSIRERGFNLVIIAQDTSMATELEANRMFLARTLDNKTIVRQEDYNGEQ